MGATCRPGYSVVLKVGLRPSDLGAFRRVSRGGGLPLSLERLAACDTPVTVKFDKIWSLVLRDCSMLKTPDPQRKTPSRKAVLRAVASSTAVETGRSVAMLEQKLQESKGRFAHIKLAR